MPKFKAAFIEPMFLLRTDHLPEGPEWYKLKLDGYRALAIKTRGTAQLRPRNYFQGRTEGGWLASSHLKVTPILEYNLLPASSRKPTMSELNGQNETSL